LIVVGTGLLKPNISSMVGRLYGAEDRRRDAGFSIYYLGINLGAFVAPLVTGWLAQGVAFKSMLTAWGITPEMSWHWGFAAAAVGMALGLVQYLAGGRYLGDVGYEPAHAHGAASSVTTRKHVFIGVSVVIAAGAGIALLVFNGMLSAVAVTSGVGYLLLFVTLGFFVWLFAARSWTPAERKQLIAIVVLFVGAAVFWSLFEQAGSTLNLFAQRSTRNVILSVSFPASWWQSLNSAYIILLVPVMAWLWVKLGSRDPSSPTKFTFGLLFAALGFAVLAIAAQFAVNGARVSPLWLALVYLLHTIGELCLSPVGLSAMTKLAPARIAGLVMGVWFLAASVGNYLGGAVASLYETFALPALFTAITAVALLATLFMAFSIKPLLRMLKH
jgi:POT family proton-dependent oligopeptide transporter